LISAIKLLQFPLAKLLVENGSDVNKGSPLTATITTASTPVAEYMNLIKLLIRRGADVNTPGDWPSLSPLAHAIDTVNEKLVRLLIQSGASAVRKWRKPDTSSKKAMRDEEYRTSLLFRAIKRGNERILKILLENGAGCEIHTPNDSGDTTLLLAIQKNSLGMVRLLLEYGADPATLKYGYNFLTELESLEDDYREKARVLLDSNLWLQKGVSVNIS